MNHHGSENRVSRKRNRHTDEVPNYRDLQEDEEKELLSLSLYCCPSRTRSITTDSSASVPLPSPTPSPASMQNLFHKQSQQQLPPQFSSSQFQIYDLVHQSLPLPLEIPLQEPLVRQARSRRNPTQAPREGKTDTVPAPFPWATNRRGVVHSLEFLKSKKMTTISGEVQCKRCDRIYEMEYDLTEKFMEVGRYLIDHKEEMCERAPSVWKSPVFPGCRHCNQENCVKPVISKKKKINWLFLLLGQMLGCCTLDQLKYFCKHTKNHRTGAKDRILYLTYLTLCKQLDPTGPFNR